MKKIFLLVAALVMLNTGLLQAQAPAKTTTTTTTTHVTKSGQPDKRYKENKTTTTKEVAGPKKKDGTPDMRYKENKEVKKTVKASK